MKYRSVSDLDNLILLCYLCAKRAVCVSSLGLLLVTLCRVVRFKKYLMLQVFETTLKNEIVFSLYKEIKNKLPVFLLTLLLVIIPQVILRGSLSLQYVRITLFSFEFENA